MKQDEKATTNTYVVAKYTHKREFSNEISSSLGREITRSQLSERESSFVALIVLSNYHMDTTVHTPSFCKHLLLVLLSPRGQIVLDFGSRGHSQPFWCVTIQRVMDELRRFSCKHDIIDTTTTHAK